jgi:hypothetical protein
MIDSLQYLSEIVRASVEMYPTRKGIIGKLDYAIPIRLIFKCADDVAKLHDEAEVKKLKRRSRV